MTPRPPTSASSTARRRLSTSAAPRRACEKVLGIKWVLLHDEGNPASERHSLTWYDSRPLKPNRSTEWCSYYKDGATANEARDRFTIIRREANCSLGAPVGSNWEQQLVEVLAARSNPAGDSRSSILAKSRTSSLVRLPSCSSCSAGSRNQG